MKLLLVDDEKLTRYGLLDYIPWKEIGISEVETAEDGRDGLKKALKIKPDIILADVRMPHMDGITMAYEIKMNYDCCFIFMSGYCDKEYLKSAIELSAVNYIEKPIEPMEVIVTLKKAVKLVQEKNRRILLEKEYGDELEKRLEDGRVKAREEAGNWESSSSLALMIEEYIKHHFRNNSLTLTELTDRFQLTKQYLCCVYKKETGITINHSILAKRMEWAKEYMHSHMHYRIKDVAKAAGFTDSNYFIKCFKKHYGTTPMDYLHSEDEGIGE